MEKEQENIIENLIPPNKQIIIQETQETQETQQNPTPWYCYILRSTNPLYKKLTYNGSTNNVKRRLRQHNSEITGGAKATKGKGIWEPYAVLTGFQSHQEALSCEWRIKHPTNQRKRPSKYNGINGRINALNLILSLDNWTIPCKELGTGLCTNRQYTLYLADDVFHIININNIKQNIIIKRIEELEK